jgi:hypothetical protein
MLMICHNVYDKDDVKHDDILHPQGPHGEWVCTKKKNIVKDIHPPRHTAAKCSTTPTRKSKR